MAKLIRISGMSKVLRNLVKSKKLTGQQLERGLKKAGLFIQRESQKIVPVKTTNLKGTARTDKKSGTSGFTTDMIVHYGAGAEYAVYVHEMLDNKHKKGKRAKFLESVVREKRDEIFKRIAR